MQSARTLLLVFVIALTSQLTSAAEYSKGQATVPDESALLSSPWSLDKLREAAASRHVITRIDAVRELAARRDSGSRPIFRERLGDVEPAVRRMAVLGLARTGNEEDAPALSAVLDDPEPMIRHAAGMALMNLAAAPTADAVLERVGQLDCRPRRALVGLGRNEIRDAVMDWGQSPLVIAKKVLLSLASDDVGVRDQLATAVGDRNRCVRYVSAYALGSLSQPGIAEVLDAGVSGRDVAVIAGAYPRFLESPENSIRRGLARGAASFDDPDLVFALRDSSDPLLQAAAERALVAKGIDLDQVIAP